MTCLSGKDGEVDRVFAKSVIMQPAFQPKSKASAEKRVRFQSGQPGKEQPGKRYRPGTPFPTIVWQTRFDLRQKSGKTEIILPRSGNFTEFHGSPHSPTRRLSQLTDFHGSTGFRATGSRKDADDRPLHQDCRAFHTFWQGGNGHRHSPDENGALLRMP